MNMFQYNTNSNAAPFFSDSDTGFIESESPMSALKEVVKKYKHPAGLYAATINEVSIENKPLARYLSSRAATSAFGGSGTHQWKGDKLFVDDKEVIEQPERYETI